MSSRDKNIDHLEYSKYLKNKFTDWTSGNERIDDFVQERQSKIEDCCCDVIFEWIPYSQFDKIKEIGKNGPITVCSAIWKNGPLTYNLKNKEYTRDSNKEIVLILLHDSQNSIEFVIKEVKKYSPRNYMFLVLYGISQNPDTKDYILVQNNSINLTDWKSGNEKIDDFIRERQLKTNIVCDVVFEWIPYSQFDKIKETGKNGPITVCSAIWKNGPLTWKNKEYTRDSNKEIALTLLHDSQNSIEFVIKEAKKYSARNDDFFALCGISQNPDTNEYILIQNNINRTSGDVKIDNLIQEIQLKTNKHDNTVLEWIPYNEFDQIEEAGGNHLMTVYSAIWSNGPLYYNNSYRCYIRDSKSRVILKCLHNSQNLIESVINKHLTSLYGISQNIYTKDYILVQKDLTDLYSVINEKIVDFIREIQLKTKSYMFKWIPYYQFEEMKKIDQNKSITVITVYSAIWKDDSGHSIREVVLKCLHDSQDLIEFVINEVKEYLTKDKEFYVLSGISQNPYTNDYILVLNNSINLTNWTSGNEKVDNFIWKMQLKINNPWNTIFEWIPYNQLFKVKEENKNNFITVYSAIWKNGPLYYSTVENKYTRDSNKKVALKCLHNSQNYVDIVINEVKSYSIKEFGKDIYIIYGISQNPDTNDYILVLNFMNHMSGNKEIDNFVQEMQLKTDDIVFEWIPYNKFYEIKEIYKNSLATIYSAIWRDGPLNEYYKYSYKRNSNKNVILKQLNNSQNLTQFVMNEVKKYPAISSSFLIIYGISQNSKSNDYILVQDKFINTKNSPTSNEKINKTIQEIQFEILKYDDLIFEWIPYNQFDRIKQIGKGGYSTVYSAIWKDGPLYLESQGEKYKRVSNKEIALKCLNNSQNLINELLKEVKAYSTKPTHSSILKVYGISQDPSTKNYIIVLHYAAGGRFDHWMSTNENYKHFNWKKRIQTLFYIASGLRELHDKQVVHRDFHTGNILFSNPFMKPHINNKIFISDMGLCGEVGNIDKTKIYGVTPYIAPEVLRGKAYTEAADIYSFGMIMYFVATERQPFDDRAHDERLVVNICDGVRPEINDQVAPRCYIDLMKKCWDSNPINRPDVMELYRSLSSISMNNLYKADIEKAENYRILHFSSPNDDRKVSIHPQAFYTSRLLNSSTENLLSYIDDKSECSDCAIINE
ncbi:hypothetical protein RclHR1_08810001 [Rhizophagus clarus]|uniref:Protein kinase domain-containing protein n=1 Tax=Rhizophagus clarus TaxID=94130 RepID=A0A2Z6SH15_9GLOM|nr:hypothetical protein RclHR1_08810001 [Rhizophagus clarus]